MRPLIPPNTIKILTIFILLFVINLCSTTLEDNELLDPCPSFSCPKTLCEMKKMRGGTSPSNNNFCEGIQCIGMDLVDCSSGGGDIDSGGWVMYAENITMCGCCPGCVKYLGLGEPCEQYPPDPTPDPECSSSQFCPLLMHGCSPGLECPLVGPNEKTCSVPEGSGGGFSSCPDKRALWQNRRGQDLIHWEARCEKDGSYSPRQCKGGTSDGTCFCVSRNGTRIFGAQRRTVRDVTQTCACSRRVHELRERGHIASFHCSQNGNFEPLQCDTESGLCYCVEPETGRTTGAVLPESLWKSLPCYSLNYTIVPDAGYYRICESEWAQSKKLVDEARLHGLSIYSGSTISCDFDGSYAPVQNTGGMTQCVNKIGALIGNYREREGLFDYDCRCVRDEIRSNSEGIPFHLQCTSITGNYDIISPVNPEVETTRWIWRCVDRDGFMFGDPVENDFRCCLFGDLDDPRNCSRAPENVREACNSRQIRPCYSYAT